MCIRTRQITVIHSASLEMLTHLDPSMEELLEVHPEYFGEIDNCPECVYLENNLCILKYIDRV